MNEEQALLFGLLKLALVFAIASFFLERALFQVFHARVAGRRIAEILEWGNGGGKYDLKPWISKGLSCWIIWHFEYDAFEIIFSWESHWWLTLLVTGFAFSAGSTFWFKVLRSVRQGIEKGQVESLFQDVKPVGGEPDEYELALSRGATATVAAAEPTKEKFY